MYSESLHHFNTFILAQMGSLKRIDQDAFSAISDPLSYLDLEINYILNTVSMDWIGLLQNLKHLTLTCSFDCAIYVDVNRSVPSLQTIQIINIKKLEFETPLCNLFPT